MHTRRIERLRLLDVNAPEIKGAEKAFGLKVKEYVTEWIAQSIGEWPLIVQTYKTDNFGRYLGTVWRASDRACLNDDIETYIAVNPLN